MTGVQAAQLAAGYIGCDSSKFRAKYKEMTGVTVGGDWCCVFASCIVVGWAGAKIEGLPGTWCPTARVEATNAGRSVPLAQAQPGDVVYYEFSGNQNADHVGIVESYKNGVLTSIEGNVSSRVGRRSRTAKDWKIVWVVRPTYAKVTEAASGSASKTNAKAQLKVDGIFGSVTCTWLQRQLQKRGFYKGYLVDGVWGVYTKKEYQRYLTKLGYYNRAIDGVFGTYSVMAEQRRLAALGLYDRAIDGDRGVYTKKALQKALNAGTL